MIDEKLRAEAYESGYLYELTGGDAKYSLPGISEYRFYWMAGRRTARAVKAVHNGDIKSGE